MGLVAAGLHNREIAARIGRSPLTVSAHIRSILEKTDARCRTEAVMIGLQEGWLPCPKRCPYRQGEGQIIKWGGTA